MPNKIGHFMPWRLMVFVKDRLNTIASAAGYNCDVAVFDNWEDYDKSNAKCRMMFDAGTGDVAQNFVGDTQAEVLFDIEISGEVEYETENPRKLAMSLEQDARTALQTGFTQLRTYTERGCSGRFGRTLPTGGNLQADKFAGFRFPVTFKWSQDSNW